ncbi:MAG TPA: hypothetical protein VIV55_00845 [Flavobacterium sp.]
MKKVILFWTIILLILCGYVFYQSSNIEGSLCNKIKEKFFHSDSNPNSEKIDFKYLMEFSKMDILSLNERMTDNSDEQRPPYNVGGFGNMIINYTSNSYEILCLQRVPSKKLTSFNINVKGNENLIEELRDELVTSGYEKIKKNYIEHYGHVGSKDILYEKRNVNVIIGTEPSVILGEMSWIVTIILGQDTTTKKNESLTQSEPTKTVNYFIEYNGEKIKVTEQNIKNGYIPVVAIDKQNGEYTDLLITKNADGSLDVKESGEYYDGD